MSSLDAIQSIDKTTGEQNKVTKTIKALWRHKAAVTGGVILLVVVITALLAPLIAPFSTDDGNLRNRLLSPTWVEGNDSNHLLGTDHLGRDVFTRLIYGSRISLLVGLTAVTISGLIGTLLGLLAGYYGGKIDSVIMRIADVQMAFPFILLALAVMAVLGSGLRNVIIVLGITGWVIYARMVRAEVLSVKERVFVESARALGQTDFKIIWRHILPNIIPTIVVVGTLRVANVIIAEASLTFLGLGIEPGIPSWGSMLADGRNYIDSAWWVATIPGLAIMFTVLGINLIGDWLRDVLDPRLKNKA